MKKSGFIHLDIVMVPLVGTADQHWVTYTDNPAVSPHSVEEVSVFCSLRSIVHMNVNGCCVSLCEDFINRRIY